MNVAPVRDHWQEWEAAKLEQRAAELTAWLESPEGQQALAESLERAQKASEKLTRCRRPTWEELNRPVTI